MDTMNETETGTDRLADAKTNARNHAESILELYQAHQKAEADDDYERKDEIQETARERSYAINVRSDWYSPGEESAQPSHFRIVLAGGGPALQLMGELSQYSEPEGDSLMLQVQDWGTLWTDYIPENMAKVKDWRDALEWFACQFSYGE